jgi:hypothetical protein
MDLQIAYLQPAFVHLFDQIFLIFLMNPIPDFQISNLRFAIVGPSCSNVAMAAMNQNFAIINQLGTNSQPARLSLVAKAGLLPHFGLSRNSFALRKGSYEKSVA